MISLLLALVLSGRFLKVIIYDPQCGHSFLDCDRDLATVKRKNCHHDRISQKYENLIKSSLNTGKFTVKHVKHKDIVKLRLKLGG